VRRAWDQPVPRLLILDNLADIEELAKSL